MGKSAREPTISVVVLGDRGEGGLPWEEAAPDDLGLRVRRITDRNDFAEAVRVLLESNGRVVADFVTGVAPEETAELIAMTLSDLPRSAVSDRLRVVCKPAAFEAVDAASVPEIAVSWAYPPVYTPAMLETRRLLVAGRIGNLRRVTLELRGHIGRTDLDLALVGLFLLGEPSSVRLNDDSGRRTMTLASEDVEIRVIGVHSSEGAPEVAGSATGSLGTLWFSTDEPFISLDCAGVRSVVPLPEGSGLYYCVMDVYACTSSDRPSAGILPASLVGVARRVVAGLTDSQSHGSGGGVVR